MQEPVFRVGEWLITPANNTISRDGRQRTLEPRLIDMLKYFAQHPDVVLSRDELIENIWKRNIVTDHVVTQCISELRKYLKDGDKDSQEYIITVPKRGYKLAAPVMWCEEGEDLSPLAPLSADLTQQLTDVSGQDATAYSSPSTSVSSKAVLPAVTGRFYQRSSFWVWLVFLAALSACVAFVGTATLSQRVPVSTLPVLLNPRDIDIRIKGGSSCNNWTPQLSYVVGLSELLTDALNTYSTFLVHDQTNYNFAGPSSSGKSLYIEFVNQRHYRAQQCFLSVRLVNNADGSIMLDKRYFITADNQLQIQTDFLNSLSSALKQPWPTALAQRLALLQPHDGLTLQRFYQAHQWLIKGDIDSLNLASEQLNQIIKDSPDFVYAAAEKALVDLLRHSYQPLDASSLAQLRADIARLGTLAELKDTPIMQQIYTVDALSQGGIKQAYLIINKAIELQMSWLNYVLLGKLYEMKGENHLAADAYITAFNLRPGENTLHWIRNGLFQTSVTDVVPYLDSYDRQK